MQKFLVLSLFIVLVGTACKSLEMRCAERFPQERTEVVRTEVRTDTILLPDHYIEFVDTTTCLPSVDTVQVVKIITRTIPGQVVYHEVVCTDTVAVYVDQAKINYLSEQLRLVTGKYQQARHTSKLRTWMFVASCLGCLLLLFLWARASRKT